MHSANAGFGDTHGFSNNDRAALRRLPVLRTGGASNATVARNFGYLLRISWLWLLIMLPVYAVIHAAVGRLNPIWWKEADQGLLAALLGSLLPNVIELPALASSIAVAWHRLVLRGERVAQPVYLRLHRVVWRYALWSPPPLSLRLPHLSQSAPPSRSSIYSLSRSK